MSASAAVEAAFGVPLAPDSLVRRPCDPMLAGTSRRARSTRLCLLATCALAAIGCSRPSRDLRSPNPEKRAAAVAALAAAHDAQLQAALLIAQRDSSALVRKAAVNALVSRGDDRAVDALGKLLLDRDPEVIVAAAKGIGTLVRASRSSGESEALRRRARTYLVAAYPGGGPQGRAEILAAMQSFGASLREAVESEAKQLWERNVRTLANGSLPARCGAAEELGRSGRVEAAKQLLGLLESQRGATTLASAVIRGLGTAGDPSARPVLEELLEENGALAEAATEALGTLGDPNSAPVLARAAAEGPAKLAQVVLTALEKMPQAPQVGNALCSIATRAIDPEVTQRAARLLRLREADCPERMLMARLGRRGPETTLALAALTELGLTGGNAALAAERVMPLVVSAAAEPAQRALAAEALGRLGHAPGAALLLKRGQELAQNEAESPAELAAVIVALARLRPEEGEHLAAALIGHPQPQVRAGALEALGLVGGEGNRQRVAQALEDPDWKVRLTAVAVLGRFRAAGVSTLAGAVQRGGEAEWRVALARALGETGSAEAVKPLAVMLEGAEAAAAAQALGRLGGPAATKALLGVLERSQGLGRLEAIEALGQLSATASGPALVTELTSDRPEVRAAAARALGRLRFEGASTMLEALRADYYGDVRRCSVDALARLPTSGGKR